VVAAVAKSVALHNGNIVAADQHASDPPGSRFFVRTEIEAAGFRTWPGASLTAVVAL
jgi:formyltetrahydrofolate hydrolase